MPCAAHAAGRTPPPALRRFRLTARVWQHPSWPSRPVGYITAIAEEVFSVMRTAFEEIARADPLPAPGAVLRRVHRDVYRGPLCSAHPGRQGLARLVAQVWVETPRNPRLAALLREGDTSVEAAWGAADPGIPGSGTDPRGHLRPRHRARSWWCSVDSLCSRPYSAASTLTI